MNPYVKAVQSVIRLAGCGLIIVSGVLLLSNWAASSANHASLNTIAVAAEALCLVAGLIILLKSRSIAHRILGSLGDDNDSE